MLIDLNEIKSLYSLGNLLSGDVVCNCILENDRLGIKNRCSITDVCPKKSADADVDFKAAGETRPPETCEWGHCCIRACPQVCGRQSAVHNVIVGRLLPG